jgi:RNase E specificity factor CsrD
MIPQMSYQETEIAAKQLTKLLFQLQLPKAVSIEEFFHIGVVHFPYGEKPVLIMEELNRALLVAVHQKTSGWFLAEPEEQHSEFSKGTVKWRALLENILDNDLLFFYYQKVMRKDSASELYSELLPRITDQQQNIIATGTFFAMAEKCGLDEKFERKLLEKVLVLLVSRGELSKPIAINLGLRILMDKSIQQWFVYELMQLPRYLRNNLVIEVSEHLLEKHYLPLRSALNLLQKIGCKIVIDDVGKSVVSTEYIIDYNIDYLKLHPSLVRDIHLRKTNQIALQSLMASCLNSRAKIIAVGIENIEEWKCLLKLGVYAGQGTFFSDVQPL